jgi:hypothetical protein
MVDNTGIEIKADELSEIINKGFIELSLVYAGIYEKDGKNFVTCFIKYGSIRTVCEAIVSEYRKIGAFDEMTGDFTDYANKQPVGEKWKNVLADVLLIIFNVIKK